MKTRRFQWKHRKRSIKNDQTFCCLVRSRFSQCSGHRTVPQQSNFECFRPPNLLYFTQNVHRVPLAAKRAQFLVSVDQQIDGGSLCTFCVKQSKVGKRKHSKFDRSGTVRWPEQYENRDLTRRTSKICKLLHFKH